MASTTTPSTRPPTPASRPRPTDFGVESQILEPNEDGSNRGDLLRSLAEDGYDLVIGVGFLFAESMQPLATEFPETQFAIIDDASFEADNVTSLVFAEEQGSFLVGAAAALTSGTDKIGFIGGVETPLIQKFQAGFEAGVAEINPDAEVEVNYLTQPPDFSGFGDPASAKTVADGMYADDIDVVYHAAGGSGGGLFEAAADADRLAIGVDSDQYQQVDEATQPCILTSMLKRVDRPSTPPSRSSPTTSSPLVRRSSTSRPGASTTPPTAVSSTTSRTSSRI